MIDHGAPTIHLFVSVFLGRTSFLYKTSNQWFNGGWSWWFLTLVILILKWHSLFKGFPLRIVIPQWLENNPTKAMPRGDTQLLPRLRIKTQKVWFWCRESNHFWYSSRCDTRGVWIHGFVSSRVKGKRNEKKEGLIIGFAGIFMYVSHPANWLKRTSIR